jgi:cell division septation protein DedD
MRQVLRGLAILALGSSATPSLAQQGSLQLSAAAQGVTGAPDRAAGQGAIEPDFGVTWLQPGSRFGTFQIDVRGTNRTGRAHLGRTYVALRDVKARGVSWTFEGGDAYATPSIGAYRFSNLFTPAVTFSGAAVSGRTSDSSLSLLGGRATALRNIFGSDPETLGQTLATARVTHRFSPHLEVQGRASDVRTRGLKELGFSIASSRQAGGGATLMLTPAIQLVGDGSIVSYRREGTNETRRDASFLGGTSWLLARGWLQINAFRFSPGEFPAVNYPLQDREGVFAAGDYDVFPRFRVFAGIDSFRANLRRAESAASSRPLPGTNGNRRFGGFRFQLWSGSALTLRVEDGDRVARPIRSGFGSPSDTDTGAWSAEWQALVGPATSFLRYSRRENVDRANSFGSYTLQDGSAQVFVTVSRSVQVFGLAMVTETAQGQRGGNTYWQAGGGTQVQVPGRDLWMRAEGTLSRNVDLLTDTVVPRESLSLGLNGQLARGTTIGFDVYVDRSTLPSTTGSPWLTRSTLRLTHRISTGTARVSHPVAGAASTPARGSGTGSILGTVFADWNANGAQDADEGPLDGIPIRVAALTTVATATNGQFAFHNVPAGMQEVGVDTTALPIEFDPPAQPNVQVELTRGETRRVAFGLIPLGSIAGRVIRDLNANGVADPGEEPIDGAIVILDGGMRSEQTRRGRFRFHAVRTGDHDVQLLLESIGEGAKTTGPVTLPAALTRDQPAATLTFLVSIEKRPEIRKVFPSKTGGVTAPLRAPAARSSASRAANPASPAPTPEPRASRPETRAPARRAAPAKYVIQVAALTDPVRAKALVKSLQASGYPAYLLEPPPSDPAGLFKIRIGHYSTLAAAETMRAQLERQRGEKLWITRER